MAMVVSEKQSDEILYSEKIPDLETFTFLLQPPEGVSKETADRLRLAASDITEFIKAPIYRGQERLKGNLNPEYRNTIEQQMITAMEALEFFDRYSIYFLDPKRKNRKNLEGDTVNMEIQEEAGGGVRVEITNDTMGGSLGRIGERNITKGTIIIRTGENLQKQSKTPMQLNFRFSDNDVEIFDTRVDLHTRQDDVESVEVDSQLGGMEYRHQHLDALWENGSGRENFRRLMSAYLINMVEQQIATKVSDGKIESINPNIHLQNTHNKGSDALATLQNAYTNARIALGISSKQKETPKTENLRLLDALTEQLSVIDNFMAARFNEPLINNVAEAIRLSSYGEYAEKAKALDNKTVVLNWLMKAKQKAIVPQTVIENQVQIMALRTACDLVDTHELGSAMPTSSDKAEERVKEAYNAILGTKPEEDENIIQFKLLCAIRQSV